ncbi:MAG TPA: isopentenyl-diphosphate Delta-isomerase [Rhodanobacteraceae bacterium]|nr:isopentenyl-diphosphate Delta-isomerase [Rhodanobacteraceae bacterium]
MASELPEPQDPVVSFESEELIRVDSEDRDSGYVSKAEAHDGHGLLHRAFSLFVFNERGELLLQQRSRGKRLWPGYWANTCCSHPRRGESMAEATRRRLRQEIGISCELEFLYKFRYQADFGELGAEHELCWVYVGTSSAPVEVNRNEVEAWRFVAPADLDDELAATPGIFTPWLKLEWQRLRSDYRDRLPGPRRRASQRSSEQA